MANEPKSEGTLIHFTESVTLFARKEGRMVMQAGQRAVIHTKEMLEEILKEGWGKVVDAAEAVEQEGSKLVSEVELKAKQLHGDLLRRRMDLAKKIEKAGADAEASDQQALDVIENEIQKLEDQLNTKE